MESGALLTRVQATFAGTLGAVKSFIGARHQILKAVHLLVGVDDESSRNTGHRLHRRKDFTQVQLDGIAQTLGEHESARSIGVRHEQCEFIAADARHHVGLTSGGLQVGGEDLE